MSQVRQFSDGGGTMTFDVSFLPVMVRTYSGPITAGLLYESVAWLGDYLSKLPRQAKIVLISDTRGVTTTDPKSRKIVAQESKKIEPLMRAHNLETIVILDSPVLRGAIKAITWITTLNLIPAKDLEDAFRYASESLAKVGQKLPLGLTAKYRASTAPLRKSG